MLCPRCKQADIEPNNVTVVSTFNDKIWIEITCDRCDDTPGFAEPVADAVIKKEDLIIRK